MSELSDSVFHPEPAISSRVEALMTHASWVRALARSLVGDPHLADDLVQDTWVAALQRPPTADGNTKGWLGTVLRNLVRQNHRAQTRRKSHESKVAPSETPAENELVERVATEKSVVEAVLALEEPYRTAVLMRYYEDIPPRKIAVRLGVPVSTVHTRITRGIEKLRAKLDRKHGGREAWLWALIPAGQPAGSFFPIVGAAVMNSKLYVVAAGAVALIVGTVSIWPDAEATVGAPGSEPEPGVRLASDANPNEGERTVLPGGDEQKQQPGEPADRISAPDAKDLSIKGRLVDANATPLVGRTVGFYAGKIVAGECKQTGRTLDNGIFELTIPRTAGMLQIKESGWRTVLAPVVSSSQPQGALIVAAPEIPVTGHVFDEFGNAVADAVLQITLPASFRARFGEISDSAAETFVRHRTDAGGSFRVADACFVDGGHLRVQKTGYETVSIALAREGHAGTEIRMRRTARAADTISGQVVDRHGQVVADAWVTLGTSGTKSDAQGAFTVKLPTKGPNDVLMAIKKGTLPGKLEKPSTGPGADGWPAEVVLRLGGEPLTIAGLVVDADGKPVPRAKVWVFDGQFAGRVDNTTATVQGLVLGSMTRSEMMRKIREDGANPRALMRSTPTAMWPFVHTAADGTFELRGLTDRDFVIRAMIQDTLLMVESGPVRAGERSLRLQLPKESYYARLRGKVVSKRGVPIAGAEIFTMCDPAVVSMGEGRSTQHETAQHRRTDKRGEFVFERVPRNLVYIRVNHDNIVPIEYGRHNEGGLSALVGDTENVVIEVDARAHFKIELSDAARADSFSVLDAEGAELTINQFQGRGRTERRRQTLHEGKSGVLSVAESAAQIVLYKGDKAIDKIDVSFRLGEVNEVRR